MILVYLYLHQNDSSDGFSCYCMVSLNLLRAKGKTNRAEFMGTALISKVVVMGILILFQVWSQNGVR